MKTLSVICSYPRSLYNFRGELIKQVCKAGVKVDCLGPVPDQSDIVEVEKLGASYREYSISRNGLNPLSDIKTFFSLFKYFSSSKTDVALAYTIKPVIWTGLALYFIRRPKFYALITGLGYVFNDGGFKRLLIRKIVLLLYRLSFSRANKVIFQNRDDMSRLIRYGVVAPDRCSLIEGSGVDVKYFYKQPLPNLETIKFVMIARLLNEKGVRIYVDAARELKAKCPNVEFGLLGPFDDSLGGINRDEVAAWEAEGVIRYLGVTSDVRPVLEDSHVFVLPSFYGEGLPRTILEAMAIGRPVLTTDNVGCRETVRSGENGFLVPVKDVRALVDKISWFIEHKEQLGAMGEASHRMVMERFESNLINKQFLEVFGIDYVETRS